MTRQVRRCCDRNRHQTWHGRPHSCAARHDDAWARTPESAGCDCCCFWSVFSSVCDRVNEAAERVGAVVVGVGAGAGVDVAVATVAVAAVSLT